MFPRLKRLLKRPRTEPHTGRPPGSGRWADAEDFLSALETAVDALEAKHRRPPTQQAVSRYLYCDDRTLRRWLKGYGISWQEVSRRGSSEKA